MVKQTLGVSGGGGWAATRNARRRQAGRRWAHKGRGSNAQRATAAARQATGPQGGAATRKAQRPQAGGHVETIAKPKVWKLWTWIPCGNGGKTNGFEALDVDTVRKPLQNQWFETLDVDTVWKPWQNYFFVSLSLSLYLSLSPNLRDVDGVWKPMALMPWTWAPCGNHSKANGFEVLETWKALDVDIVWKP